MVAAPLCRANETLPFIPGYVVADEVQRNNRHAGCRHLSVWPPVVVHQLRALPDARQRLAG